MSSIVTTEMVLDGARGEDIGLILASTYSHKLTGWKSVRYGCGGCWGGVIWALFVSSIFEIAILTNGM